MSSNNPQFEAAQQQVNDIQNTMHSNLNQIMERDGKLSHLEKRAENLQVSQVSTFGTLILFEIFLG